MSAFSVEIIPVKNNQLKKVTNGIYIFRKSEYEYYACKNTQNRGVFVDAINNLELHNKVAQIAQKVHKFETIENVLNYLNETEEVPQEPARKESLNLNKSIGIQQPLEFGFSDLPLFTCEKTKF